MWDENRRSSQKNRTDVTMRRYTVCWMSITRGINCIMSTRPLTPFPLLLIYGFCSDASVVNLYLCVQSIKNCRKGLTGWGSFDLIMSFGGQRSKVRVTAPLSILHPFLDPFIFLLWWTHCIYWLLFQHNQLFYVKILDRRLLHPNYKQRKKHIYLILALLNHIYELNYNLFLFFF